MRVAVIGAGIIGVATAHALAKAGLEVDVYEKADGAARGASYANAGQISPTLAAPWAVPGLLGKLAGWLFARYPPLRLSRLDPEAVRWLFAMLRAANSRDFRRNKQAMVALSVMSLQRLKAIRADEGLDYPAGGSGTLVLLRDAAGAAGWEKDLAVLEDMGLPFQRVTRDRILVREPHLNRDARLHAGVLLPLDETGDCHAATLGLEAICRRLGVRFHFGTPVAALERRGGGIGARTAAGPIDAEAFVLCAGVDANRLLRPLGRRLPVYPVKGYSLTVASDPDATGPTSTVADELYKVGVTHLGDRIRVGGTAEIAGYDSSRPEGRFEALRHVVRDLFPKVPTAALAGAETWSGLRPMTAAGPPLIGRVNGVDNLWLNVGHGTLGWTMGTGAGALIAQLVAGETPEIDPAPYAPR